MHTNKKVTLTAISQTSPKSERDPRLQVRLQPLSTYSLSPLVLLRDYHEKSASALLQN
jgi:hypothetical protein